MSYNYNYTNQLAENLAIFDDINSDNDVIDIDRPDNDLIDIDDQDSINVQDQSHDGNLNGNTVLTDLSDDDLNGSTFGALSDDELIDFDNNGFAQAFGAEGQAVVEASPIDANVGYHGSFNGVDSNQVFDTDQVNGMVDNDSLYNPQLNGSLNGDVNATANGGYATATTAQGASSASANAAGYVGLSDDALTLAKQGDVLVAGDDLSGAASATADALAQVEALTQTIVLGANMQANSVSMTVVGESSHSTSTLVGEDDAA